MQYYIYYKYYTQTLYVYIIYNVTLNNKEYYFFRSSEFHAASATIFRRMNNNDKIDYNIMVLCFK